MELIASFLLVVIFVAVGLLVGWFVGWFVGWLVGWLVGWFQLVTWSSHHLPFYLLGLALLL
jgi:hypothetical protein